MNQSPFTLHCGDALSVLRTLPDGIADTCVTSPPYFGLRDYGMTEQIGLEETPEQYISRLVEVFRGVRRVLSDDGTLWVNIGDSYAGATAAGVKLPGATSQRANRANVSSQSTCGRISGIAPKNLIGVPWMLAFALRSDGWYLRSDIIWSKPNPMPESVTDRPTKAHEYIFLLSKSERYYYDYDAIAEPVTASTVERMSQDIDSQSGSRRANGGVRTDRVMKTVGGVGGTRNKRSVWTVATKPYKEAHFAVFPPELITPCILAGSREGGTVIDPFNGSGTTGAESCRLGRQYIGIELNPAYIELTRKRLAGVTAPLFVMPSGPTPKVGISQETMNL